jgi:PKD repeat protein
VSPGTPADDPTWSSDSTRIAFVSWDPETFGWTPWSFVSVINADGTGLSWLASARSPAWRPWHGGVNDRPVASLTVECNGLTCTLDGSSSSDSDGRIIEYGWRFDDGSTASGAIVSHMFEGGRAYDVRLVVMDNGAALATAARTVDLNQPPVVSFTATCSGLTCMFDGTASSDPDGTIASFFWRFGDYTDSSGPATMTHTYAAAGTYVVMLTATDGTGTGSQTQTVSVGNVNALPFATFTPVCTGMTCSFDASGSRDPDGIVTGYAWNFGDAASDSGVTAKRTYAAPGTYMVTLKVTDNGGATSTYAHSVTVVVPELHVGDLDGASAIAQNTWTATVTITIHDRSHSLLSTAVVTSSWSDGSSGSCITDGSGLCVVSRSGIPRKTASVSFAVTNVAMPASAYLSATNHDSDGDSNGTAITVRRQ